MTQSIKAPKWLWILAGVSYAAIILIAFATLGFVDSVTDVDGNGMQTAMNIVEHISLFRIGVASEVVMYVLVIALAAALYLILKPVDGRIALFALVFRVAEGMLGLVAVVLSGVIPVFIAGNTTLHAAQQYELIMLFHGVGMSVTNIVLLLIGIGGTLFCVLFWVSKEIPRWLSGWGVMTYVTIFAYAVYSLLFDGVQMSVLVILFAPGSIFELVVGIWLTVKGIRLPQQDSVFA